MCGIQHTLPTGRDTCTVYSTAGTHTYSMYVRMYIRTYIRTSCMFTRTHALMHAHTLVHTCSTGALSSSCSAKRRDHYTPKAAQLKTASQHPVFSLGSLGGVAPPYCANMPPYQCFRGCCTPHKNDGMQSRTVFKNCYQTVLHKQVHSNRLHNSDACGG